MEDSQNKKYGVLIITICLALSLFGCGGSDGKIGATTQETQTPRPSHLEVAARSNADCSAPNSKLDGQWHIYHPYEDVLQIGTDCVVESYQCDSIGYIDGPSTEVIGIVDVEIVWVGYFGPNCLAPGRYRCAYDTSNAAYHQMVYDCH